MDEDCNVVIGKMKDEMADLNAEDDVKNKPGKLKETKTMYVDISIDPNLKLTFHYRLKYIYNEMYILRSLIAMISKLLMASIFVLCSLKSATFWC